MQVGDTEDFGLTLLEPAEMALADRLTVEAGTSGHDLMRKAGIAVADDVVARHPHGTRVLVLCGPGNNGGDGFVAARVMAQRGLAVRLALLGERDRLTGDAARAAAEWRGDVLPADAAVVEGAEVIVDALYGAGLSRDLDGEAAALVDAVNAAAGTGARVLAVDLPSGIDGRTGAVRGTAVRAERSVTFFRRKPGHLLMPGRVHAGRVIVADIGIRPTVLARVRAATFANAPPLFAAHWPSPGGDAHKYARGAVLVASGPAHSSGAARLAAAAALHAGAGIVTVACPPEAVPVVAAYRAAFVVKPFGAPGDFAELVAEARLGALVAGPGLGLDAAGAAIVAAALASPAAAVLDADALTLAATKEDLFRALSARSAPTVLTPHEGEFRRLFPDVAGSKLERVREAARRTGAVVLLKGADTVVADPDGRAAINDNAPPSLATAGSGDVLAGIVGGLLAAGVPTFEAAAMGVHVHGRTGSLAGPGAIADDLVPALRAIVAAGPWD